MEFDSKDIHGRKSGKCHAMENACKVKDGELERK